MKKQWILLLLLPVVLIWFAAVSAQDGTWTCENGHGGNTGKFCSECGAPKPEEPVITPVIPTEEPTNRGLGFLDFFFNRFGGKNETEPAGSADSAEKIFSRGIALSDAKDPVNAAAAFRQAADMGYAEAQYTLGCCYDEGFGVEPNDEEAVKWYRLAADQGHAGAQYNLGLCFINGEGPAKNDAEAVRWFKLAADQNHAAAQYAMFLCSTKGYGMTPDPIGAMRWHALAIQNGYSE